MTKKLLHYRKNVPWKNIFLVSALSISYKTSYPYSTRLIENSRKTFSLRLKIIFPVLLTIKVTDKSKFQI